MHTVADDGRKTDVAEVVIIGGGIIGTSIAYNLAKLGCQDVIILERKAWLWFHW